MKLIIDADARPVVDSTVNVAKVCMSGNRTKGLKKRTDQNDADFLKALLLCVESCVQFGKISKMRLDQII